MWRLFQAASRERPFFLERSLIVRGLIVWRCDGVRGSATQKVDTNDYWRLRPPSSSALSPELLVDMDDVDVKHVFSCEWLRRVSCIASDGHSCSLANYSDHFDDKIEVDHYLDTWNAYRFVVLLTRWNSVSWRPLSAYVKAAKGEKDNYSGYVMVSRLASSF